MKRAPSLEDIFAVMSAVSFGQATERVPVPEDPQIDDVPTRLAIALNVLLDDLSARTKAAEQMAARLGILAEASHDFSAATQEPERLLATVARRLAEVVKDQCIVRLLSTDGRALVPVALHDSGEGAERRAREVLFEPVSLVTQSVARSVHESGEPFVVAKVDLDLLRANTTPTYFEYAKAIGLHSFMIVPLRLRGRSLGQLGLGRHRPESPPFDGHDLTLACALADHAAIAIDNSRSYAAERDARAAAEKDATERARLEGQLRQSQKMEAVGRLAGGVAHDFNNLLSVILSYGLMLLAELKPGDPIRGDIEEITKAGKRAADLTQQLLMFSRRQVLEPRVVDLNELLTSMDNMLQRILGADVDLVSLPTKPLGRVRVDPSSVEQVIMNLVVNARDAMPTGGKLTMETGNVVLDEAYAEAHIGVTPGPHVMLAVTDTGMGIDEATMPHIFEPFFTTKAQDKGTGLGLSTVLGIVQQSGGSVWVYSERGKGTTFKVYIPCVDAAVATTRPVEAPATLRGSETILLVEDDDQVRAVARGILRKNGYHVIEARSAGEALLHSEKYAGTIHLLLSDVVMPQMSGPELAKRLAGSRPEMKVLCMSGYTDDSVVRHGVLEAHLAYLQKPLTPAALSTRVREVLDARNGRMA